MDELLRLDRNWKRQGLNEHQRKIRVKAYLSEKKRKQKGSETE